MLIEDQHPDNKTIMVALLGAPNVGKSSLINYLLGVDLTVVTSKPQTTRNKLNCVVNIDHTEIVLVDTPGLHNSSIEFNKRLNEQAREGADGADLNLLMIDLNREVLKQIVDFKENFRRELGRSWLVFTKADLIENAESLPLQDIFEKAKELIPSLEKYFVISVKEETNTNVLTGALCDAAHPGPHFYPDGSMTNRNERFFVTEYIRQQAFELLKDELPYELAVIIDEYRDVKDRDDVKEKGKPKIQSHISASILVNRPSQRAIVIGSKGAMIKEIGTRARVRIEELVGGQVHLNLHVKVSPRWFKNNFVLEEIGLPRAVDSTRVWRKK
jgi:GTP-binding protein Era